MIERTGATKTAARGLRLILGLDGPTVGAPSPHHPTIFREKTADDGGT